MLQKQKIRFVSGIAEYWYDEQIKLWRAVEDALSFLPTGQIEQLRSRYEDDAVFKMHLCIHANLHSAKERSERKKHDKTEFNDFLDLVKIIKNDDDEDENPESSKKPDCHQNKAVEADFFIGSDLPAKTLSERKTAEAYEHIIKKPLPFASFDNLQCARQQLHDEFPHAVSVIDELLSTSFMNWSVGRTSIKIQPTILLGSPGTGKSRLARRLCEVLRVPYSIIQAAGSVDDHALGVSRGWSTSCPSMILNLVSRHSIMNPAIIVDEVEKAVRGQNGDFIARLLPLLEKNEAKDWLEPHLGTHVNASHVGWLMTANSLDPLPTALRSRCRILKVPGPQAQHVGVLVRRMLDEIADAQGIDRRWYQSLDIETMEVIRNQISEHRSMRVLRRHVEFALKHQKTFSA